MAIGKNIKAIACECNGYAEEVKSTEEELELGMRAFACRVCNKRIAERIDFIDYWD